MRLHKFILNNLELILSAWSRFARTVDTGKPMMDEKGLRNHAQHILKTVAEDMQSFQSESQQIAKSEGRVPSTEDDAPSQTHAMTRFISGFTMDQMVSEYRALRSSVLRLWLAGDRVSDEHDLQDMIRFNEAIDQALIESIATYGEAVESTRKTVLGVLGHDLRSPLGAVLMASDLLCASGDISVRDRKLAGQISISVRRANQMVGDLLDLARCNLGSGLPVNLEKADLKILCESVVEELRTGYPRADIELGTNEAPGMFDPSRIEQVFTNLISNAILHGDLKYPIRVTLSRKDSWWVFSVQNRGELIPESVMPHLFNPQARYSKYAASEKGASAGLGLGLFIAAEIVQAHGGMIDVVSTTESGTLFTVRLPVNR
ncbi:sensor histidine kinase [Pseudomonas atacamensis]|uniref:sensor histidine kinase n=1 Tax=Pseudomonas atacamensis TaxID=2565368 RepID=UPI002448A7B3|nr:HAMP domain-containing sensor histidine kinase [Pseudomonas atacamensis]MDH2076889.1 HAMP domain-containing histidine kinase [Pseudomonas atacamensis]